MPNISQPVMIYRCPNCKYTDKTEFFNTTWVTIIDKNKQLKICPECGSVFANNMKYIDKELYRLAEGFGLIGKEDKFS